MQDHQCLFKATRKPFLGSCKLHKRCFICWPSGCSVRTCRCKRDKACIKKNLDEWERLQGLPKEVIHYTNLIDVDADSEEINEAFITLAITKNIDAERKTIARRTN